MIFKELTHKNAKGLLDYLKDISSEENKALFLRKTFPTLEQEKKYIKRSIENGNLFYGCIDNKKIVGLINADKYLHTQLCHSCKIGVTVLANYRNLGIGTKLIEYILSWAKKNEMMRVELDVFSNNPRAYALYKRLGFDEEGRKKNAVFIIDESPKKSYCDIIEMVKML